MVPNLVEICPSVSTVRKRKSLQASLQDLDSGTFLFSLDDRPSFSTTQSCLNVDFYGNFLIVKVFLNYSQEIVFYPRCVSVCFSLQLLRPISEHSFMYYDLEFLIFFFNVIF